VGVSTDELVYKYKGDHPLMSYEDRTAECPVEQLGLIVLNAS